METSRPQLEERPLPLWQKLTALSVALIGLAVLVIFRDRLRADAWPPDDSRVAPNLLASIIQWAIVLTVAALLWPPTRRRIHRFVDRHTAPLHAHFDRLHEQREAHQAEQMAKLEAIHDHLKATHPLR